MITKRPLYLQDQDDVQDALKQSDEPLTIQELAARTNRNYGSMQQATVRLRNAGRVSVEKRGMTNYYSLTDG